MGRHTKVNRCLTEGRQALTVRMAGIEGGIECARLAPLLSALADGEADAQQLAALRPHLKTCLSCRARLREFRAVPGRVAALVPAALVASGGGARGLVDSAMGALQQKAEALLGATQHKAAVLAERTHTAAELMTGQKVAALAASAAALAGGGTAVDQLANHQGPPQPPPAAERTEAPVAEGNGAPAPSPSPAPGTEGPATSEQAAPPAPPPEPPPPQPPDPAKEFGLGATPAARPAATDPPPQNARRIAPAAEREGPAGGPASGAGGSGAAGSGAGAGAQPGEFAP